MSLFVRSASLESQPLLLLLSCLAVGLNPYSCLCLIWPQVLTPVLACIFSAGLRSQPLLLLLSYLTLNLNLCSRLCLVWLRVSTLVLACVLSGFGFHPLLLLHSFPLFTSPPDARFFIDTRLSLLFVQKTVSPLFSHLSFITNFYHPSVAAIHVSLSEHHSQKLLLFLIIRLILVRPTFTFLNHFYSLALESSLSCKKYSLRFELFKSSLFSQLLSSSSPIVQVSRPFCKTFSELASLDPMKSFCSR